jgi:putative ABC transport system permease protein
VSPGYFKTMNIPLIRGRAFEESDREGSVRVAIVDQTLADRMFPGQNPLGKRVSFEGDRAPDGTRFEHWREIVGVVGTVKYYGITVNRPFVQIYVPYTQLSIYAANRRPTMALFVRTSGAPDASVAAIRNTIATMDPGMPLYGVRTMNQYIMGAIEQPRLSAALLIGFAGVALTLALVGVYGVLAYTVSQRTREIGVRIALGAERSRIIRNVVWDGAQLSIAGIVVGLALAWPATKYIQALLYNVQPGDAGVFGLAAAGLLLTALAASWLPARRASAVQPIVALRGD